MKQKSSNNIDNLIVIKEELYTKDDILTNSNSLELVNKFFNDITSGDKEVEELLYSIIGYSLTKTSKFAKAFIFKGKARNGKSCIFRILESILTNNEYIKDSEKDNFDSKKEESEKDNDNTICNKFVSHENIERLSGSKAGSKNTISFLKGCTVNIAEDQKQPKYINTGALTKLISGEPIAIGQVGKEKEDYTPYATMLFSVNEVIDFKEFGLNLRDRFVILEFKNTFLDENNNRDINIIEKLCEDIPLKIIIFKAINAFKKANEIGKFLIPKSVEESTKNYFMDCNEVLEFSNLYPITKLITKSGYYKSYKDWCNNNNKDILDNASFGKRVMALGCNEDRFSFAGKRETYYISKTFSKEDVRNEYNKYLSENKVLEETVRNCSDKTLYEKHDEAITWNEYLRRILYGEPTKQN